jgi:thiol-disulfide isomerase/thioredoxin
VLSFGLVFPILLFLCSLNALADPAQPLTIDGALKQVVQHLRADHPKKTIVLHFFNYGCGSCYQSEETLQKIEKDFPETVYFESVPVDFHGNWEMYAKIFYVLEQLKEESRLGPLFYGCVHSQQSPCRRESGALAFLSEQLLEKRDLTSVYRSKETEMMYQKVKSWPNDFGLRSVPAFVVIPPTDTQPVLLLSMDARHSLSECLQALADYVKRLPLK